MPKLYLDTSVVLKRYLAESGTELADIIFDKAESGELIITISLWNIGEALGVLDEKRRKGGLTKKEYEIALKNFNDELAKLIRLKTLDVVPLLTPIVTDTWGILMNCHIYEADALQITTCMQNKSDALISSDEKLIDAARRTGLQAFHLAKDEQELRQLI